MSSFGLPLIALFLSTPSARRATDHRPDLRLRRAISIHALREVGDYAGAWFYDYIHQFLSTPSARRATQLHRGREGRQRISIHALREEGDVLHGS